MLQNLRLSLKEARALVEEKRCVDIKYTEQKKKLAQAGGLPIDAPATQRLVGDARMILDLCEARNGFLKDAIPESLSKVHHEYMAAADAWQALVSPKVEALKESVLSALRPFYQGAKRRLENDFSQIRVPAILEIEEAIWEPAGTPRGDQAIPMVEAFIRHVVKWSNRLEIPIEKTK